MQIRTESPNHAPVSSPTATVEQFQQDTVAQADQWAEQLQDNPDKLADIEQQIDTHYRQGAGQLVASLLGQVTDSSHMKQHVQTVRDCPQRTDSLNSR